MDPSRASASNLRHKLGIEQFEDLIERFCRKVLFDVVDIDGGLPLLTDESSLIDFTGLKETKPSLDDLVARIEDVYGIACDDIDPPTLVRVLARLRLRCP